MTSPFGQILTGDDVQDAIESTIRLWIKDYLAEVADHSGRARGDLPVFRSYARKIDLSKFEEDQIPACIIVAPGTMQDPTKNSRGIDARWSAGVGAIVSGQNENNTYQLAQLYGAALRTMLLQQSSLLGFAIGTVFVSERYDELPQKAATRNLAAAVLHFGVDVRRISEPQRGPVAPREDPTQPPAAWPTVSTVETDLTRMG